jgi:hypothetical protein
MKNPITLISIVFLFFSVSCNKDSVTLAVDSKGTVQQSGFTTYQYGTHVLRDSNGKITYALKSETLDLNKYIGKSISKIYGNKIKGYPVDGGPEYINVTAIH